MRCKEQVEVRSKGTSYSVRRGILQLTAWKSKGKMSVGQRMSQVAIRRLIAEVGKGPLRSTLLSAQIINVIPLTVKNKAGSKHAKVH